MSIYQTPPVATAVSSIGDSDVNGYIEHATDGAASNSVQASF